MNYINTDSFGNSYLNGFSSTLPLSSFRSFNDLETGGIINFFNNAYTSSQFWTGTNTSLNFLPPSSKEGNTPNGILRRFKFDEQHFSSSPGYGHINTIYSGSESFVRISGSVKHPLHVSGDGSLAVSSSYKTFSICNSESICAFRRTSSTFGTDINTGFISLGWLDDIPTFSQNSPYRTGTAYILYAQCGNSGNSTPNIITTAYRVGSEGGSAQAVLTSGDANYAITCQSGGPPGSTWATNLVLIDSAASPANYAMGSVRNVLLGKGTYTVGTVYKVAGVGYGEANTSPNTEQQHFLCVGTWGTDYLLMRVWTEGYQ